MPMVFWMITVVLTIFAFGFFLPWLRNRQFAGVVALIFLGLVYALYFHWGSSQQLALYYSKEEVAYRDRQGELRMLIAELNKDEYRFRLRLEENPKDLDAEWRLLDLLAIKSLYQGNKPLAQQYWKQALEKMPKNPQHNLEKKKPSR